MRKSSKMYCDERSAGNLRTGPTRANSNPKPESTKHGTTSRGPVGGGEPQQTALGSPTKAIAPVSTGRRWRGPCASLLERRSTQRWPGHLSASHVAGATLLEARSETRPPPTTLQLRRSPCRSGADQPRAACCGHASPTQKPSGTPPVTPSPFVSNELSSRPSRRRKIAPGQHTHSVWTK